MQLHGRPTVSMLPRPAMTTLYTSGKLCNKDAEMEYKKRDFSKSRVGQQLGNYRIVQLLGRGNFADVYLGEHIHLNTLAAIKVLDMRLTNEDMNDFLREARTIAHLRHPHIVQVLEFDVESGVPYLVMDYAAHGTLRQQYAPGTSLSPETILPYIQQIAAALHYAHNQKIIHRDVKPENMLLGEHNQVLLSDFGIAVVANSSRTQSMRGVAGTIVYMAPEQLRGKPVPASDQYSLAAVAYEWLTGSLPFSGSFVEIATHQTLTPPPSLREKVPDLSAHIEAVILKALAKDATQRFASIQEFATAFEQACRPDGAVDVTNVTIDLFSSDTAPLPALPQTSAMNVLPIQETTITTYRGHTAAVKAVAWEPHELHTATFYRSRIASASDDGTIQIWEAETGRKILTYRNHSGGVNALAWSANGKYIASAGVDSTVQVWTAANMRRICTYSNHSAKVTSIAWSPLNSAQTSPQATYPLRIASASVDGSIQIWEATSGRRTLTYHGHEQDIRAVAWSPDGKYIASTGEDMTVQIWLPSTGHTVFTYRNHMHEVLSVAWSPDGKCIASGGADQNVQVWEALTGNLIYTYTGHQFTVSALAWSSDGQRIASASFDRTVQVWEASTGANAVSYPGHSNWVYAVAWSPTSPLRIASGGGDKTVQVWLVE